MQFSNPVRTDLVISMTLAETFLLLVFVVWFSVNEIVDDDVEPPHVTLQRLRDEIRALTTKNAQQDREISELKTALKDSDERLKWWRENFGGLPPGSSGEFEDFTRSDVFKMYTRRGGTGHPPCQGGANLLVEVSVLRGVESIRVLTASPGLAAILGAWGAERLRPNVRLETPDDIARLLGSVLKYTVRVDGRDSPCRFHYRLLYETAEDYLNGCEKYDKYFYPRGRLRALAAANPN